jgi:hypothetical protein
VIGHPAPATAKRAALIRKTVPTGPITSKEWRDRLLGGTPTYPAVSRYRARRVVAYLKAILGEAQRRGLVANNPATP